MEVLMPLRALYAFRRAQKAQRLVDEGRVS